ncbi:MAG: A24 family peptidase [Acidobacteriota bacterium]
MIKIFILASVTAAGIWDLRYRRIPNWLIVLTVLLSLSWHSFHDGLSGLWTSSLGLIVGLAFLFPIYLMRGIGAGDVKLMGALGAAVTFKHIFTLFVISAIIAGIMAIFQAIWSKALLKTVKNMGRLGKHVLLGRLKPHAELNIDNDHALKIPFGVSVTFATWLFVFFGRQ